MLVHISQAIFERQTRNMCDTPYIYFNNPAPGVVTIIKHVSPIRHCNAQVRRDICCDHYDKSEKSPV